MNFIDTLIERNAEFADTGFTPGLKILPTQRALILGCVDPRVDPMDVLKLQPGEAAIIRNVGGRVNPSLLETIEILRTVARAGGGDLGEGWHLILLHHTRCGIVGCHHHAPGLLTKYMGVAAVEQLEALEIDDPYRSVVVDVAALKANPAVPAGFTVTGLVYDVDTGRLQTVVPPARLRSE